jgi:FKBP-type peptidyl-prolyl cis-trans isomerase 2
MKSIRKTLFKGSYCLPLIAVALMGCATVDSGPVFKAGDEVGIQFTCRFPNGDVAATTHKATADDRSQPKSNIFLSVKNDDPFSTTAGENKDLKPDVLPGFEDEILRQLAMATVGMRHGEERTIKLTAETHERWKGEEQKLEMVRKRNHPKEIHIRRSEYTRKLKKEPEVGNEFAYERGFTAKVKTVTDKDVIVSISAISGTKLTTAFGVSTIRDAGDRYEVVLDPKMGTLVRSGGLVGRVSQVGDDKFTVDYSNPFGGESLDCSFSALGLHKDTDHTKAENSVTVKGEALAAPAVADGSNTSADRKINQEQLSQIKNAVTDAIKSGKSSVDIDLPTLSGQVAKGDLVTIRFTAKGTDGAPLTLPEGFAKAGTPQELMAGKEEIFPGLGDAVIGMAPAEKKKITLLPEKAFGIRDEKKTATFPLNKTVPAKITLPADEYVKRFGGFPTTGKEVPFIPYVTAKVESIGEKDVTLAISATNGAQFSEPFGVITVMAGTDGVTLKLAPKLGASFDMDNHPGVISAFDSETFTVDSNNPLAGKTIIVDLEVVSLTKATSLQTSPIDWIENQDAGLAQAKKEGKPVFLLLYADWCGWCKKTMTETIPDPRVSALKNKFVWMKLNSDKEIKYKKQYEQNGYPLMLVLNPDGTLRKRIDGYRDAVGLKKELVGTF